MNLLSEKGLCWHEGSHEEKMNFIHMNAEPGQTVKINFIPKETRESNFIAVFQDMKNLGCTEISKVE
jgi:hypothetical protein